MIPQNLVSHTVVYQIIYLFYEEYGNVSHN